MEDRFVHLTNGQEVLQEDLNLLGEVSSLADDRVFAELFRLRPYAGEVAKGILPFGVCHSAAALSPLVRPSTGKVIVSPFRAFVGSRTTVQEGPLANWRDVRSAICIGDYLLSQEIALAPTDAATRRWDLVYAIVTVDADAAVVERKRKNALTGQIDTVSIPTRVRTLVSLDVIQGASNEANPPPVPNDAGDPYFIPLAYVRVPPNFSAATQLKPSDIWEIAPVLSLASATGAGVTRPADQQYLPQGTVHKAHPWSLDASQERPSAYMPSCMVGSESLLVALDLRGDMSHPSGSVIDGSRNWRARVFRWTVCAQHASDQPAFAWNATGYSRLVPCVNGAIGTHYSLGMGQSLYPDHPSGGSVIATLEPTVITNIEDRVSLFVDMTGAIRVEYGNSPNAVIFLWLEASGQFSNK